jgi:hypothetical protein
VRNARFRSFTVMTLAIATSATLVFATLTATSIATESNYILGCWLKRQEQLTPNRKGKLEPRLEYCFHPDGRILGIYVESDGYAGDDIDKR